MQTSHGGSRPVGAARPDRPRSWRGGPHDGPPRGARPRARGEEAIRGGRRSPQGGAGASLGRAEGGVAPQPPERGGRGEGPSGARAPVVTPRRIGVGSGSGTGKGAPRGRGRAKPRRGRRGRIEGRGDNPGGPRPVRLVRLRP